MPNEFSRGEFIKDLYGRMHRVDIWNAVLRFAVQPPELFRGLELQEELETEKDIPKSVTHLEIKTMKKYGMIEAVPRDMYPPGTEPQSVYYRRTDSPVWIAAEAAIQTVEILFPTQITE